MFDPENAVGSHSPKFSLDQGIRNFLSVFSADIHSVKDPQQFFLQILTADPYILTHD
jgi:hypothetical protein